MRESRKSRFLGLFTAALLGVGCFSFSAAMADDRELDANELAPIKKRFVDDCSRTSSINKNCRQLFYDKEQDIYYDYNAVCEFVTNFLDVKKHITNNEWQDIRGNKFANSSVLYKTPIDNDDRSEEEKISTKFYVYESNGVKVQYTMDNGEPLIWDVIYSAQRLPKEMRDSNYYINKLNIYAPSHKAQFEIGCDSLFVKLRRNNNAVIDLQVYEHLSVI